MLVKQNHLLLAILLFSIFTFNCKNNSTESKSDPIVLSLVPTNVSVFGVSDGSIDLTVTGGEPPFQFEWSNGETSEDIDSLKAGVYIVIVTDINTTTISDSVTVKQPQNPLKDRNYIVHVPNSYSENNSVPLVIALHNRIGNGQAFEEMTGFSLLSESKGFIVVYPDATGYPKEWNEGLGVTPSTLNVDDISFLSALIDLLLDIYNIDSNRVYITGFSSGSLMSHILALEISKKITAIGTVCVHPTNPVLDRFPPMEPVSIIHFYMEDDQSVFYTGGTINGISYPHVEKAMSSWIIANGCEVLPTTIVDTNEINAKRWASPESNIDVEVYGIKSGGHNWLVVPISMTETIWQFFDNHSK